MKKIFPIFVLAILLVVAVSVVGALPGSGWKSGQQVQKGRLARPRGAHDRREGALLQRERHPLEDRNAVAVDLVEAVQLGRFENRGHFGNPLTSGARGLRPARRGTPAWRRRGSQAAGRRRRSRGLRGP